MRMVQERHDDYPSLWATIQSIAPKIGCVPQTLHEWVRRHDVDYGMREQLATRAHQGPRGRGKGTAANQRDTEARQCFSAQAE
jgi:transposase-like protein